MSTKTTATDNSHPEQQKQPPPKSPPQIYKSLLIPFSTNPTISETSYKTHGLQRTKGTLFIQPPSESVLKKSYNNPPRPKSRMSSGAIALCKHFERIPDKPESKRDALSHQKHPFWPEPRGSNENKTQIAEDVLCHMLREAVWRNVLWVHSGVACYEVRNAGGWGMRWTLGIEEVGNSNGHDRHNSHDSDVDGDGDGDVSKQENGGRDEVGSNFTANTVGEISSGVTIVKEASEASDIDPNLKEWRITTVTFRGFLEPIEGMSHELPSNEST